MNATVISAGDGIDYGRKWPFSPPNSQWTSIYNG